MKYSNRQENKYRDKRVIIEEVDTTPKKKTFKLKNVFKKIWKLFFK